MGWMIYVEVGFWVTGNEMVFLGRGVGCVYGGFLGNWVSDGVLSRKDELVDEGFWVMDGVLG